MKPLLNTKRKKGLLLYDSESWFQKTLPNEEKQLKDLRPIKKIKLQKMLHP